MRRAIKKKIGGGNHDDEEIYETSVNVERYAPILEEKRLYDSSSFLG